jgi:UDP:flavonoid glycosyltransferase YjiC (YdhE family)
VSGPGRFLIVSWDGGGNTPPALNLGARLVRQGHQVRLLGWESMAPRAAMAGVEFATYPSVPPWPPELAFEDALEERLLPALAGPRTRDDILTEAKGFAPDVVVVDCMMGAGLEAAHMLALPSAVLVHLPYSAFMYEWGDEAARAEKARFLNEAGMVLVLVPPGFDRPCRLPANTRYVGPITDPNPRQLLDRRDAGLLAEPGDPWVLLSLSTTLQGQAAALPKMLDAVAALPVRVLLTLGWALPASAVDPPANVTVRGFVPHHLLLPQMAAVISHGGLSTITAALTAGVPLLCIPQGRDQSDNAERVAASGVGRAVATDAAPAQIAGALEELLADPAALRAARRFADVIAGLGGGAAATREVAGLARSRPRSLEILNGGGYGSC